MKQSERMKRLCCIALAAVMTLLLCACGKNDVGTTDAPKATATPTATPTAAPTATPAPNQKAMEAFRQGKYEDAAKWFAQSDDSSSAEMWQKICHIMEEPSLTITDSQAAVLQHFAKQALEGMDADVLRMVAEASKATNNQEMALWLYFYLSITGSEEDRAAFAELQGEYKKNESQRLLKDMEETSFDDLDSFLNMMDQVNK